MTRYSYKASDRLTGPEVGFWEAGRPIWGRVFRHHAEVPTWRGVT